MKRPVVTTPAGDSERMTLLEAWLARGASAVLAWVGRRAHGRIKERWAEWELEIKPGDIPITVTDEMLHDWGLW